MTNRSLLLGKTDPIFLIDSNIILDILLKQSDTNTQWSVNVLQNCTEKGELAINQIIYAEIATIFSDPKELNRVLVDYQKLSLPWEAGFIASKAFAAYRKNGGKRETLMPDFYIGAHALYARLTLVTRDKSYPKYFPNLKLISP